MRYSKLTRGFALHGSKGRPIVVQLELRLTRKPAVFVGLQNAERAEAKKRRPKEEEAAEGDRTDSFR